MTLKLLAMLNYLFLLLFSSTCISSNNVITGRSLNLSKQDQLCANDEFCSVFDPKTREAQFGFCKFAYSCNRDGGTSLGTVLCGWSKMECCSPKYRCGKVTKEKFSYFESTYFMPSECVYTIKPYSANVCQIRLDFEEFILTEPKLISIPPSSSGWNCVDDYLEVITPDDFPAPRLCGYNSGQHIYIPIGKNNYDEIMRIRIKLGERAGMGESNLEQNPRWRIRITQIECPRNIYAESCIRNLYTDYSLLAPPGCLQYYTEKTGAIRNFGYDPKLPIEENIYVAGLKYGICIKESFGHILKFDKIKLRMSGDETSGCGQGSDHLYIPDSRYGSENGWMESRYHRYCGGDKSTEIMVDTNRVLQMRFVTDSKDSGKLDTHGTVENGFEFSYHMYTPSK